MGFRDHFSSVASRYAVFRPQYPEALFDWLASIAPHRDLAWDCACGSGQASRPLAKRFEQVIASDASLTQISAAPDTDSLCFVVAPAEKSPIGNEIVDLVTVAQALHWFACDDFFAEVRRVARPGAVFAAWTGRRCVSGRLSSLVESSGPRWRRKLRGGRLREPHRP